MIDPPVEDLKEKSKKETVIQLGRLEVVITTTFCEAGGKGCTI